MRRILVCIFAILFFWWGINFFYPYLEDFYFVKNIENDPYLLEAQVNQFLLEKQLKEQHRPLKKQGINDFEISAKSALIVYFNGNKSITLFKKNPEEQMPIASLTKLMTANIVLDHYDLDLEVEISQQAVDQETDLGNLSAGERLKVKDLLYLLLIESSNDAAFALTEILGEKPFVELMNQEAAGLENTVFIDAAGLDPDYPEQKINLSSAQELVELTNYLLEKHPLLWEISSTKEYPLFSNGEFHHKLINTNILLNNKVIGSKTGWTPESKGCLLMIIKALEKGYIISVLLGSEDRFREMENLIKWTENSYIW